MNKNILAENMHRFRTKNLLTERVNSSTFKMGHIYDEIHNRQYVAAKGYMRAGAGGGAVNYNDFSFSDAKVVKIENDTIVFLVEYGHYNTNDIWKDGQNEIYVDHIFLVIPLKLIQEVRDNQVMISISNSNLSKYITKKL